MQTLIREYLAAVETALTELETTDIERITDILFTAYREGRQVFTLGNGASAALASHMACDIGKGTAPDLGTRDPAARARRFRIISLTDNVPLLTAYGNDLSYDDIFAEQLRNLLNPGDVVIGVSGSGGSPNVLRALEFARSAGATTIGLTGSQPKRFLIEPLCDVCLAVPLVLMEQIEDVHVVIHHIISLALRSRVREYHASSALLAPLSAALGK